MKKIIMLVAVLLIFLVACSDNKEQKTNENSSVNMENMTSDENDNQNESNNNEENNMNAEEAFDTDPLPENIDELVEQEQGKYGGDLYNRKDGIVSEGAELLDYLNEDMPEISNDPSEEELEYFYRESLKLVQDDYLGEEDILKDLKFQLLGTPEVEDSRYQFKEQLNIEILLDASGSMIENIDGSSKMDIAKDTITSFLEKLPEETNVALRVYGHEGSGSTDDKELSCNSSEIMYGFNTYEADAFAKTLNKIEPVGWTPNGLALSKAQEDLKKYKGKENTNIVYMVSDGMETCDSKPVEVASDFYNSNIEPIINIIGFDVDSEGQNHLKEIADAAEGTYQSADNHDELANEFDKINQLAEAWKEWKKKGEEKLDLKQTRNSIDIFVHITNNTSKLWNEQDALEYIFKALLETDEISEETFNKLEERNKTYHKKMREEMEKLEDDIESWNEDSYKEALEKLDKKYKENK